MAARAMAQDLILCDMCETSPVQMHCNSCAVNLCNDCVIKHVSTDTENGHHVVLYKKKNTKPIFPTCKTHKEQNCEMKCQQCDTPVCIKCVTSESHTKHKLLDLMELSNSQKNIIKQKTTELETCTYPNYEKAVSDLQMQLQNLPKSYENLMSEISSQGEEWHREVDIVINQRKQEAEKKKSDDLANLSKNLEEAKSLLSALHQAIVDNNELLKSNNVIQVLDSKYTSPEMWNPPPSIDATPPTFTPLPIQGEQLRQMFGNLTAASMPSPSSSMKLVEDKLATAVKQLQLLDSPACPSSILTECNGLYNIAYLSPDQVWVSGYGYEIKRFTIPGSLQETVTTTTSNWPWDITVNRQGDLIYTDHNDRSINKVRHGKIEKIISLQQDWYPMKVCCTACDDLLVFMNNPSMPNRMVRYSGSTEKQVIQHDEQGNPLFSSGSYHNGMYIAENSEKDVICVSDWDAKTVVVVDHAGKLRFKYKGNPSRQKCKSFEPCGVATDSMRHILVADRNNHCIHIIDEKGHFLRYIDNCQLKSPIALSLDRNNTLYVAESNTSKVKVIKYLS